MKATVSARVTYIFEVDIPSDEDDIVGFCDCEDPVYHEICRTFVKHNIDFEGEIVSIIEDETDKVLYMN